MSWLISWVVSKLKKSQSSILFTLLVISLCLGAGLYFKYLTKTIDSPIEQVAEQILEEYGMPIDFSADKKDLNAD